MANKDLDSHLKRIVEPLHEVYTDSDEDDHNVNNRNLQSLAYNNDVDVA